MEFLSVDKDKCSKCGICVDVCPSCILEMGANGPECHLDRGCMSCGHCVAICPTGAMNNKYVPREEQEPIPMPVLDSTIAYNFLRMRRSIRNYKAQVPTDEELRKLLEICRFAPTASNSQGLYFKVITNKEKIQAIAEVTAQWMEKVIEEDGPEKRYFKMAMRAYRERGKDIIARHAPVLVFATTKRLNRTGVSNAEQSWAYAELYAPTIGLGTTIAGFIETCGIAGYQPLLDLVGVPARFKIVGTLMVGYPKYKFRLLTARQKLRVEFDK